MHKKLIIKRKKELNNRKRSFDIFINNIKRDSIYPKDNEKVLFFDSNEIEIQFKIDWCSSKKRIIKLNTNQDTIIEVSSSISNLLWYIIVGGISLSIIFLMISNQKIFLYIAYLIFFIPLYKITIGKNKYLNIMIKSKSE